MRNYHTKSEEVEQLRRKRISATLKGKRPKNLESIQKLERTSEWRMKVSLKLKGRIHSLETRRKISETKRNPLRNVYMGIRECYKYREWRQSIFQRDNWTCVLCLKRGGELNVDHYPKRFVDILRDNKIETVKEAIDDKELWDTKNGRTLCVQCHTKTDTYGNKVKK